MLSIDSASTHSHMPVLTFSCLALLCLLSFNSGLMIDLYFLLAVVFLYPLVGLWLCSSPFYMIPFIFHIVQLHPSAWWSLHWFTHLPSLIYDHLFLYVTIVKSFSCSCYFGLPISFSLIIISFLNFFNFFLLRMRFTAFDIILILLIFSLCGNDAWVSCYDPCGGGPSYLSLPSPIIFHPVLLKLDHDPLMLLTSSSDKVSNCHWLRLLVLTSPRS